MADLFLLISFCPRVTLTTWSSQGAKRPGTGSIGPFMLKLVRHAAFFTLIDNRELLMAYLSTLFRILWMLQIAKLHGRRRNVLAKHTQY